MKNVFSKNQELEVEITSMSHNGQGIARKDNFVFFVPYSCIGDFIRGKIIKLTNKYGILKIIEIKKNGKERINIDCPYYLKCGGCDFRHISYNEEIRLKTLSVKENLKKISGVDVEVLDCIKSLNINNYRNKCQNPISKIDKVIVSGFFRKKSHDIIEIKECKLEPSIFTSIRQTIVKFANDKNLSTYDENTKKGLLKYIYLRKSNDDKQVMLALIINGNDMPFKEEFVNMIKSRFKVVNSILLNINKNNKNNILGLKNILLYGKSDCLKDNILGFNLEIPINSFYQINYNTTVKLYQEIKKMANLKKSDIVVDLFCGIGSIGLTLSNDIKHLYGIEIVDSSIKSAINNANVNNVNNTTFICGDTKYIENIFQNKNIKINTVIIDPARKGCDIELLNYIIKSKTEKVIMVSCNTSTMCRDLKVLIDNSYKVEKVQPFDMFPRTYHVETVVLMSRIEK